MRYRIIKIENSQKIVTLEFPLDKKVKKEVEEDINRVLESQLQEHLRSISS